MALHPFKISTWNINSVRLRAPNVQQFLKAEAPDVLCLQEIKCQTGEFPAKAFNEVGYTHHQVLGQGGSQWRVPTSLYPPILQQGGLLNDTPDASQFYDFLFSAAAQQQIEASGYRVIHAQ